MEHIEISKSNPFAPSSTAVYSGVNAGVPDETIPFLNPILGETQQASKDTDKEVKTSIGNNDVTKDKLRDKEDLSGYHRVSIPEENSVSDASTELAGNMTPRRAMTVSESPAAKIAGIVFDTLDTQSKAELPLSMFGELVDALGEELDDSELQAESEAIRNKNGAVDKESFMRWYDEREDYDSDEDDEGGREKVNISEIFDVISTDGGISIAAADFSDLVEELGITHTAEEHLAAVEQLKDADGKISRDSLHEWYFSWLFCDKEEADHDDSDDNAAAANEALFGLKSFGAFREVKESPKPDATTTFGTGTVPSGGFTFGAPASAGNNPFTVGATGGNAFTCEADPHATKDTPIGFKFGSANVADKE
jgi:Ca2+-binding EF-hand superfamily protein